MSGYADRGGIRVGVWEDVRDASSYCEIVGRVFELYITQVVCKCFIVSIMHFLTSKTLLTNCAPWHHGFNKPASIIIQILWLKPI